MRLGDDYNPKVFDTTRAPIPNWILKRAELTPGTKLVYARLRQFVHEDFGYAWPDLETLATEVAMAPRHVRRCIQQLQDFKLIRVEKDPKRFGSTQYVFTVNTWLLDALRLKTPEEVEEKSPVEVVDRSTEPEEETLPPEDNKSPGGGQFVRARDNMSGRGDKLSSLLNKEINREELTEKQKRDCAARTRASAASRPPAHSLSAIAEVGGNDSIVSNFRTRTTRLLEKNEQALEEKDQTPHEENQSPVESHTRPDAVLDQTGVSEGQGMTSDAALRIARAQGVVDGRLEHVEKVRADARRRREAQTQLRRAEAERTGNLSGRRTVAESRSVKSLSTLWIQEMKQRYPDTPVPPWEGKEFGQAKSLLDKYDREHVEAAMMYTVRCWDGVKLRYFKGVGSVPTVGLILSLHGTIVPEALLWKKHEATISEYNSYDHYAKKPSDLRERYQVARRELEALGIKI